MIAKHFTKVKWLHHVTGGIKEFLLSMADEYSLTVVTPDTLKEIGSVLEMQVYENFVLSNTFWQVKNVFRHYRSNHTLNYTDELLSACFPDYSV